MKLIIRVLRTVLSFGILILIILLFQNSGCDKVVSVSQPDLPPPNGYLFIDSNPQGAHIYLNGKARRRATPDSITWLETGTDTITLKKELYRDTTFITSVEEGKKFSLFIDYTKNPLMRGKIYCSSKPQGASIFINDSITGYKTPSTITGLLPGYYNITYKIENHRDITSQVTISSSNLTILYSILVDTTIWRDFNIGNSGISTNELSCISIDNNDKIWIGTLNNGITILDGNQWNNYYSGGTRLPSNKIFSITTSKFDNKKWVGTESGLVEYFGDGSNDLNIYKAPFYPFGSVRSVAVRNSDAALAIATDAYIVLWPKNGSMEPMYPTQSSSEDYIINNIAFDKNGHIWFGTKNVGVAQSLGDTWEYYLSPNYNIISNKITALQADNFGTIWVGHPSGSALANGINYFDGAWQSLYILPDGSNVNSLFFDRSNRLWVGTNKGLLEKDGAITTLYNFDNTGLNITNVSGVAEDKNGNIWIVTSDAGLFELKHP